MSADRIPTGRDLPFDEDIEAILLGSILADNTLLEHLDFLKAEHFAIRLHQKIYDAIKDQTGRGRRADASTVRPLLAGDTDLKEAGDDYIGYLAQQFFPAAIAVDYARSVAALGVLRETIQTAADVIKTASDPGAVRDASAVARTAGEHLMALADGMTVGDRKTRWTTAEAGKASLASIEFAYRNKGQITGVPTGIRDLDKFMGGLQSSDLIVVAGGTGMGKTSFATTIAKGALRAGKAGAFFSLEMSAEQINRRFLSDLTAISAEQMRSGELAPHWFNELYDRQAEIDQWPLVVFDKPAQSVGEMFMQARTLKRLGRLDWVVVDHAQLIAPPSGMSRSENRTGEMRLITGALKAMAKDLDVPVIALSQLSRQLANREDKRPMLSDLRESGTIEQDADIVAFVYREAYYLAKTEPQQKVGESEMDYGDRVAAWRSRLDVVENTGDLIIAKNRHGPERTMRLAFHRARSAWGDLLQGVP